MVLFPEKMGSISHPHGYHTPVLDQLPRTCFISPHHRRGWANHGSICQMVKQRLREVRSQA
jgi:hypothetical protein